MQIDHVLDRKLHRLGKGIVEHDPIIHNRAAQRRAAIVRLL
jgi:hypothetical protein